MSTLDVSDAEYQAMIEVAAAALRDTTVQGANERAEVALAAAGVPALLEERDRLRDALGAVPFVENSVIEGSAIWPDEIQAVVDAALRALLPRGQYEGCCGACGFTAEAHRSGRDAEFCAALLGGSS